MNIEELFNRLEKLKIKISAREISSIWNMNEQAFSKKKRLGTQIKHKNIVQLEEFLNIKLTDSVIEIANLIEEIEKCQNNIKFEEIEYYPNVYLSAGYGIEIENETKEKIIIDSRFIISERGMRVNPANCKIVKISGNSMFPEYHHGDRVIIDESDKNLTDGQIYAFRYDGQCYVKEINRSGNRIKCISINKDYDSFEINQNIDFVVFGRIIPRVRL